MDRQWIRFIGVGSAAALTHLVVLAGLVEADVCLPVTANGVAWLVAFAVSYLGHRSITFAAKTGRSRRLSRPNHLRDLNEVARFLVVSGLAFSINVLGYPLALPWVAPRYLLAWIPVTLTAAVLTFLLSRHWVFAPRN